MVALSAVYDPELAELLASLDLAICVIESYNLEVDMANQAAGYAKPGSRQCLYVIRHGERLDNVDYDWERTAERPYDPPLTDTGVEEAATAARERFCGKDIKHIVSSPFLRCLQTAQEICSVLQLPDGTGIHTCNGIVDVLSGHCGIHRQPEVPAKDVSQQGIKIVKLDESPLPKYPERTRQGLQRYIPEFNRLADQYWPSNVVIVTHGYGVMQAVVMGEERSHRGAVWVDYCGHVELSREKKDSHKWTIEKLESIY